MLLAVSPCPVFWNIAMSVPCLTLVSVHHSVTLLFGYLDNAINSLSVGLSYDYKIASFLELVSEFLMFKCCRELYQENVPAATVCIFNNKRC